MTDYATYLEELHQWRERRAQLTEALVNQINELRQQAVGNGCIPVLCFWGENRDTDRVATVQDYGDELMIMRWTDIGPMGHKPVKGLDRLAYELDQEGYDLVPSVEAAQQLEQWTKAPEWERGLQAAVFAAVRATLDYNGYWPLVKMMHLHPTRQSAIDLGLKWCRELRLKIL